MDLHKEIPEKVIKSKSFGRSKTYENLLRYLVECASNNYIPKETTIAEEIFQKSAFDPSQSTLIRVYVFNLRKKLNLYYQNEGANDEIILKIPKGSYKVAFVKKGEDNIADATSKVSFSKWYWVLAIGLIVSLAINVYFWVSGRQETIVNGNGLWADLIESEIPTMIVIGDLFIYHEDDSVEGLHRNIRDPLINSKQEFEKFQLSKSRPDVKTGIGTYSYLIRNSVIWIKNLTQIFQQQEKDFTIRLMSRFNPKELQDYNLIVVGMSKTLGLFNNYNQHFSLGREDNMDLYRYREGENEFVYQPSGDPNAHHTDYGYMGKYPGPNGNNIYVFGGLWDTGASQSFKNFTETSLLAEIENAMMSAFGKIPRYYEIMFEVKGIDRMELSTKILHLKQINPQSIVKELGE